MIQKKKSTWHKNKTVPHKTRTEKQESKKIEKAKHWVVFCGNNPRKQYKNVATKS